MNWSRLLFVACVTLSLTVSFAVAAAAFRATAPSVSRAGAVAPATPMLEPRSGQTATLLPDSKVLIAGGMRRNQDFYKSAELYDPTTGKFQPTGEMAERRVGHIAVLLRSGKVLVAGGWVGRGATDSAELYDPATGKFTAIAKLTARRGEPRATMLANGDVLLTGGDDHDGSSGHLASAEVFRAATLMFQATGAMHHARVAHTATLLNDGKVLIAGGKGESLTANAELYDPKTGTFSKTGSLVTARYKHTAGPLPDGRVLIAGGSDERDWSGNLNSAEVYDPGTGKFATTSSMNDSRFKLPEEAVRLQAGKLLVAGGSREAEIFDPESGKFLLVPGQMNDKWHYMTETKLRDGSVLLAGGYANNDQGTAQTWIYRP
ncbi:MAG TPA: kelch repeat-containing protein [Candidatus Acidoferrum sp.]|nr:kelch repeat-containing protein [Candidatus Acidoferrum sp.]